MTLLKTNVDRFKQDLLGNINKKKESRRKNKKYFVVSLVIVICLMIGSTYLKNLPKIGFPIIILFLFFGELIFLFFISGKMLKNTLTQKENLLYILYNGLLHLEKFSIDQNPKDYNKSKKFINSFRNNLFDISFNIFGTEWEKDANKFIEEIVLYLDVNIIPKIRINSKKQLLESIYNKLQKIFKSIMSEELKVVDDDISEVNKAFKKDKKSFREKFKNAVQESTIVKIFISLIIIILTFFLVWGVFILREIEINFSAIILISLAAPAAIYYGVAILDKLIKKI